MFWAAGFYRETAGRELGLERDFRLKRSVELSTSIVEYLLSIQDPSGTWLRDQPASTSFDQTAEIAIRLRERSAELSEAEQNAGVGL